MKRELKWELELRYEYAHLNSVPLVYFVQAEIPEALIKIGFSKSLARRVATLRSESACKLTMLGVQLDEHASILEQKLHQRFAAYRAHNEWFLPAPRVLKYVTERTVSPNAIPTPTHDVLSKEDVDALLSEGTPPSLMTIEQLASFWKVGVPTVRRRVKEKQIPFVKVGRQIRFDAYEFARLSRHDDAAEARMWYEELEAQRLRHLEAKPDRASDLAAPPHTL